MTQDQLGTRSRNASGDRRGRVRVALIAILVVLILLLAGLTYFIARVVTPAGSGVARQTAPRGLEWIRSLYGYGPSPAQQFSRPVDTAVGPGGRIWGTDTTRGRILGFNPDGTFATQIQFGKPGDGVGQVARMEGIATDDAGNVYVCDFGNEKVLVFGPDGTFIREWPVPLPSDLAVRDGRVVIASIPGVSVFTTEGKLLSVWGKRGNGPDEFDGAHGIAIGPAGTVYVSDTLNRRVKAYDKDGKLLWIWPESMSTAPKSGIVATASAGSLQVPSSIALDGAGRLVLVDTFGFDMVVLRPSTTGATLVARYGEQGAQDGRFTYPFGVAYDPDRDWFVVADANNDRLQVLRIPGSTTSPTLTALRRSVTGPWTVCAIPLALLLLAIIIAAAVRRWRRRARENLEIEPDTE